MKQQLAHYEPWENPVAVRHKNGEGDIETLSLIHILLYSMVLIIFGGLSYMVDNYTPLLLATIIYIMSALFPHRIPNPEIDHYITPSGLKRSVEIKKYGTFFLTHVDTRTYNHYDPSKLNGQIEDIIMKKK